VVLVTGGTRGIGLEAALCFARAGARTVLTYRWGGSEAEATARFAAEGLTSPRIVCADAADEKATVALVRGLRSEISSVDALISNAAMAALVRDLPDYRLKGLERTIEASSWPILTYTRALLDELGTAPRYVVGVSSLGTTQLGLHYDFAAAGKAVLETLVRYLAWRLHAHGTRVNVVTCGLARTESSVGIGGDAFDAFEAWHERAIGPIPYVRPADVGAAIFGLCSGWLDAVSGQTLVVDDGSMTFAENRFGLYRASLEQPTRFGVKQ
jgi:NAD(P)-dependent dehydrogenase (short-subunit alcohol dehydrogenase family)